MSRVTEKEDRLFDAWASQCRTFARDGIVDVDRRRLREAGEHASGNTVRRILEGQQRITATFRRADARTLHVRKATRAEPPQQAIYDALGIDPAPGATRKTIV